MKFLVAHELWTSYIGSTRIIYYILDALVEKYDTFLLSPFAPSLIDSDLLDQCSNIKNVKILSYKISDTYLVPLSIKSKLLIHILRKIHKIFDAVITDVPFDLKLKTKLAYYSHFPLDIASPNRVANLSKDAKTYYLHVVNKRTALINKRREKIICNADVVFVNSLFSYRIAKETFGEFKNKFKVLQPPINYNYIRRFNDQKIKSNEILRIVFLGRITRDKKPHVLLEAIEKLPSYIKNNLEISIIGDPPRRDLAYLRMLKKKLLKLNIKFKWYLKIPENVKYKVLSSTHIYVHTKPWEHFGFSVIEAMATGNVAVVHRSGGPWEDITDYGKYGLGYSSVDELAEILTDLHESPEKLEKYSKLAIERAKDYDVSIFKRKLINFIEELV
jgi:glycosyltransferase involved in cell wall biosynthesis